MGFRSGRRRKGRGARGSWSSSCSFPEDQLLLLVEQRKEGEVEAVLFVSLADVFLPSFPFLLRFSSTRTSKRLIDPKLSRELSVNSRLVRSLPPLSLPSEITAALVPPRKGQSSPSFLSSPSLSLHPLQSSTMLLLRRLRTSSSPITLRSSSRL